MRMEKRGYLSSSFGLFSVPLVLIMLLCHLHWWSNLSYYFAHFCKIYLSRMIYLHGPCWGDNAIVHARQTAQEEGLASYLLVKLLSLNSTSVNLKVELLNLRKWFPWYKRRVYWRTAPSCTKKSQAGMLKQPPPHQVYLYWTSQISD